MEKIVDKQLGDKGSLSDRRVKNSWLNIDQLAFSKYLRYTVKRKALLLVYHDPVQSLISRRPDGSNITNHPDVSPLAASSW